MAIKMIDFHSHLLPGVDDGSRSMKETEAILGFLKRAGIQTVCATPHYIAHHESIEAFLERRNNSYSTVKEHLNLGGALPEVRLAAECRVERGLSQQDGVERLCYEGTDRVLFEFPYQKYESWMTEEIYNTAYKHNVKPIIAHLNRYFGEFTQSDINEILSVDDVIIQFNAEAFSSVFTVSKIKKIAQTGTDIIFGFDLHREKGISEAEKTLKKLMKYLEQYPVSRAEKSIYC